MLLVIEILRVGLLWRRGLASAITHRTIIAIAPITAIAALKVALRAFVPRAVSMFHPRYLIGVDVVRTVVALIAVRLAA